MQIKCWAVTEVLSDGEKRLTYFETKELAYDYYKIVQSFINDFKKLLKDCPRANVIGHTDARVFETTLVVFNYPFWHGVPRDEDSMTANLPITIKQLPKYHGRLIDADMFLARNAYFADKDFIDSKYGDTLKDLVDREPTVIEADKEET